MGEVKKVLELRRSAAPACRGEPPAAGEGGGEEPTRRALGSLTPGGWAACVSFLLKGKREGRSEGGEAWKGVVARPETYVPSPLPDGSGCRCEPGEVAENIPAEPAWRAGGLPLRRPPARAVIDHRPARRTGLLLAVDLEAAVEAVARYNKAA